MSRAPGDLDRPTRTPRWYLDGVAPFALAWCVLGFVATFYFLGDLGRWSDDWPFNLRDPETGGHDLLHTHLTPPFFHRPLFHVTVYTLHTLLADHFWALHLLTALSHALVTVLLFTLLRRLDLSIKSAALAAMFLLVYPSAWDVPLWATTLTTSLATALVLLAALLFRRFIGGGGPAWVSLLGIASVVFASCCFNEQPACAVAAFPLLGFAASPGPGCSRPRRIAVGTGAAMLACALYLGLYYTTAGVASRGGPGRFVNAAELAGKARWVPRQVADTMLLRHFLAGALRQGARVLFEPRPLNVVILPLLLLSAVMISRRWAQRSPSDPHPGAPPRAHRPLRIIAAGVALFLAPFLPFFMIRDEWISTRVTYAPSVGVAFVVAGLAEIMLMHTRTDRARQLLRWPLATGVSVGLVLMSVVMLGAQSGFHNRGQLDRAEGASLRDAVPAPDPHSIFVPLCVESQPLRTGSRTLDASFRSPLCIPWSARWFLRRAYCRRDLEATFCNPGQPGIVDAAPEGLIWDERTVQPIDRHFAGLPTNAAGCTILPWDRVIPVAITPKSGSLLITWIEVTGPGGDRTRFPVPQTLAAARIHPALERVALITRGPDGRVAVSLQPPQRLPP